MWVQFSYYAKLLLCLHSLTLSKWDWQDQHNEPSFCATMLQLDPGISWAVVIHASSKMILLQSKTFSQHKARWYSCTKTAINHAHQALYDMKLMNIIIAISTRMSVNKTILQSLRRRNWKSYIRRGQVVHKNFSWAFNSQKRGVGTQARQGYTQHVELKLLMRGSRQFLAQLQLKFWIGFKWYCTSNLFCGHLLKTLN